LILIDTGPLVALCDAQDSKHARAVAELPRLMGDSIRVCDPVLTEACFHLRSPRQRLRLRDVLDRFDIQAIECNRYEVFRWLEKYSEHEPDWADACLAILCEQERGAKVWSYDREFTTTWRMLDGRAVPLVT
jgi:predicted nucleic acid-binding protein